MEGRVGWEKFGVESFFGDGGQEGQCSCVHVFGRVECRNECA